MKIELAALEEVWPRVLIGLQALHEQDNPDWTVSEVYEAIAEGEAMLITDPDDDTSFAIVKLRAFPYNDDDLELFVWMAWAKYGNAIPSYLPYLVAAARTGGAKWMRFFSQRQGMVRAAQAVGFRVHAVEYLKEL